MSQNLWNLLIVALPIFLTQMGQIILGLINKGHLKDIKDWIGFHKETTIDIDKEEETK